MWWSDWLIDCKNFKSDIGFFELKILVFLMKYFERQIVILLITVPNNYSVWWPVLCEWPMVRKNDDDDARSPQKWCSWKKWSVYFWAITSRETEITTFELITIRILELGSNDDNVDRLMTARGRRSKITMINDKISCSMRITNANAEKILKIWCFDDIVMNEMIW